MVIATNQEVLDALGLGYIKNIAACSIVLEGGKCPRAELTVLIEKPRKTDWLSLINSGLSHAVVLKIVQEAE